MPLYATEIVEVAPRDGFHDELRPTGSLRDTHGPWVAKAQAVYSAAYLLGHSDVRVDTTLEAATAANRWLAGVTGSPPPGGVGQASDFPADGAGRRRAA